MPARYMGRRMNATTRLPYDDYMEAVRRARGRGWSLSQYIAHCVAREIHGRHAGSLPDQKGHALTRVVEMPPRVKRDAEVDA